jgi:hypothetical protein
MKECAGTIVIAFERKYIEDGAEKRGSPKERPMTHEKIPTVWNHIEAAQAYMLGHPVLVMAEEDLHNEGLLEDKYDWYVQRAPLDLSTLHQEQFKGIFEEWKEEVKQHQKSEQERPDGIDTNLDPGNLTVGRLIRMLRTGQLWAVIVAIFTAGSAIAAFAFWLGTALGNGQ